MATETDLLNDALGMAGGCTRITSIDDGSTNANHCLTFWPPLRDGLLRMHFWNFALTWVELGLAVGQPALGFAYAYTKPGDWLRTKDYAGVNPASFAGVPVMVEPGFPRPAPVYKMEGNYIRSNDGQAWLHYIRRVTNVGEFDALFYQVSVLWMASKLAAAIRKDIKASTGLLEQVNAIMLPLALAVDGQEGSVEAHIVDNLLRGRR